MTNTRCFLYTLVLASVPISHASAQWDVKKEFNKVKDKGEARYKKFEGDVKKSYDKALEQAATWEANVRNLTKKGTSEELWGECGRYAYMAAAETMRDRGSGKPVSSLSDQSKLQLYSEFGDTVHDVRIHWSVKPMDKWSVADACKLFKVDNPLLDAIGIDLKDIQIVDSDTEAQAYGHDIYLRNSEAYYADKPEMLNKLLSHEMVHLRQYDRLGKSLSEFGYQYFKEFKKAKLNYGNNKLEQEANEVMNKFVVKASVDWKTFTGKTDSEKIEAALLAEFTMNYKKASTRFTTQSLLAANLVLATKVPQEEEELPSGGRAVVKKSGYIKEFVNNQQSSAENQVRWKFHEDNEVYWIACDHQNPNGVITSALLLHAATSGKKVYITSTNPSVAGYTQAVEVTVTFPKPK